MSFYHGNEPGNTPGILPEPYFWWQAGSLWGTMIDYWKYTTVTQYNDVTRQSLLFQVGPYQNYLPPNITASIGNDDQGFWAMSTMLAAETGFQDPAPSEPQWLSLTQAVYNVQNELLNVETACGGGLRWQVIVYNNGYNYKNTITNAVFFNVAARLAHYTGKDTYAQKAQAMFQWLRDVGFIDQEYNVWDGAHVEHDCKDINHKQTSYLPAVLLQGAAFMWRLVSAQAVPFQLLPHVLLSYSRTGPANLFSHHRLQTNTGGRKSTDSSPAYSKTSSRTAFCSSPPATATPTPRRPSAPQT